MAPSPIRGRPKRRDDVVHALSYYDGARRLGSILERNRIATAFDVDGKRLGTFRTRREACRASGGCPWLTSPPPSERGPNTGPGR